MTYQKNALRADGSLLGAEGRMKDLNIELPAPPTLSARTLKRCKREAFST